MIDNVYKNYFQKFGIFTLFLVIVFGLLIYPSIISKKSWKNNLRKCVEQVLNENDKDSWELGKNIEIKNSFAINSECFEATKNKKNYSVIIIRVPTFYGPVSTVFTMDEYKNVEVVGFSSLHGRISKNLIANKYSKRFSYWEKKIPVILEEK